MERSCRRNTFPDPHYSLHLRSLKAVRKWEYKLSFVNTHRAEVDSMVDIDFSLRG
jgi:hypothetical protein